MSYIFLMFHLLRSLSTAGSEEQAGSSSRNSVKAAFGEFSQTKLADIASTRRHMSTISRGLWARYVERYFVKGRGSFMPIFHMAMAIGAFGYSCEYSHLSTILLRVYYPNLYDRAWRQSSRSVICPTSATNEGCCNLSKLSHVAQNYDLEMKLNLCFP